MGVRRATVEETPAHARAHIGYVRGFIGEPRHSRVPDPIRSLVPAASLALTTPRTRVRVGDALLDKARVADVSRGRAAEKIAGAPA
jgi:hypothetical protein